jgi:hypothetical protein
MTAEELMQGYARLNLETYSLGAIIKRFFGMSPWKRTLLGSLIYAGLNISYRQRYYQGLKKPQPFVGVADVIGELSG